MAQRCEARKGRGAGNGGKAYSTSSFWDNLEKEKSDSKLVEVKNANGTTTFRLRKDTDK